MLAVSHHIYENVPHSYLGVMDHSGTINPAALNATDSNTISPSLLSQPSPRGTKRNRSPDATGFTAHHADGEDAKNSKRSKLRVGESPSYSSPAMPTATGSQVRTPQVKSSSLPRASPSQASPPRTTPSSTTKQVLKALPTVRDHTTDQLSPEGDEYIPREYDVDGENKVTKDGYPQDGRKYKCRTFQVPRRGEKLFMLATECARVLGYRDSYLLFNKNRSLYKIIADQQEKDSLIQQDILPYSYRSRQIAIVTARSMFRQFGARLIVDGRRVRDDYWEAKARKQGFTEEDAAGEKRPGAAKAREQAAAEEKQAALTSLPQGEIIYSHNSGLDGQPPGLNTGSLAPLPMIQIPSEELTRPGALGSVVRPRQEMTGPPYMDRIQTSSANEILSQAGQAAEWNKSLAGTRAHRYGFLDDVWRREHKQPIVEPQVSQTDTTSALPPSMHSPQAVTNMGRGPQDSMSHTTPQMLTQPYHTYSSQPNPLTSPVQPMRPPSQMHQTSPSMNMASTTGHRASPAYGNYTPSQMWPPPQPQPSPLSQSHMTSYGAQHHSPMPPPQMNPQSGTMNYSQQLSQMAGNPVNYASMSRNMYQQNPAAQQFGVQSSAGQQPSMQGWTTPGSAGGAMPQNYGYP